MLSQYTHSVEQVSDIISLSEFIAESDLLKEEEKLNKDRDRESL